MDDEIALISDGKGLAVIGEPSAVERFLTAEGLASRDLGLGRLASKMGTVAGATHAASGIAAASSRWVMLTEKSAHLMATHSPMMTGSTSDVSRAIFTTAGGRTSDIAEIVKSSASFLTNPAVLAGVAGIMAQVAAQQAMEEITDYLAIIDQKVDDILRAQKDAVLADMIAVGLVLDEALTVRDQVGRVSDVTWSKVQTASMTTARTQAYAIQELEALAEKVERASKGKDLAMVTADAEVHVREWLVVLARCIQLQDALVVLEIDRVLDASPDELDSHRMGLKVARQNRMDLIGRSTASFLARMAATADAANEEALWHPFKTRPVVQSTNHVAVEVGTFHGVLGIDAAHLSLEAKRWTEAAEEARDKVLASGVAGAGVAARIGNDTLGRARAVVNAVATEVANRTRREADEGGEQAKLET
jgi:predicted transcriptional regulator